MDSSFTAAPLAAILLLDDSPAHRTLIKRSIRKAGVDNPLVESATLEEARHALFGRNCLPIALALLDLNLGQERSSSLIPEIRRSDIYCDLPVVVLSTSALETDIRESYAAGADCYMIKNEDNAAFSQEIAKALAFYLQPRR